VTDVAAVIKSTLDSMGVDYQEHGAGRIFAVLPGVKKLQTSCWLIVGDNALSIEAFVCRRPDEGHERLYRYLLRRNAKLYGVRYTLDAAGDIYLTGRVALESVSDAELDRLLGQVLQAADGDFNTLLELGFSASIQREWQWRVSRGESLANLQAFRHLVEPGEGHEPGTLTDS
jgi:Putative bacterial sensory transduction regulator